MPYIDNKVFILQKKAATHHCTAAIFLQSYDLSALPGYILGEVLFFFSNARLKK